MEYDMRNGNVERFHSPPKAEATYAIDTSGCGERGK